MTNQERWDAFINKLRTFIIEHHHCPNKHTTLYNAQKYYRGKMKEGKLDAEKVQQLEEVLGMRTNEHTGGRKKLTTS